MFSHNIFKKHFPLFSHHPELIYLDSGATALKPQQVIDAEIDYLSHYSTNSARGLYPLAEMVTEKIESVREKVAHFIGAKDAREIIFTSGTTGSLNLVSQLLNTQISPDDNIVTTLMEHHSNFLPWKELARAKNVDFRILPLTREGVLDTENFKKYLDEKTKIVALSAVSNVLGTITPIEQITPLIRTLSPNALIVVDAAQAVAHETIDVTKWDVDFLAFSGHKMFGPTGIGILYGRKNILETLTPVCFGGGMVLDACATDTLYKDIPARFEAGTLHLSGIFALGSALDFIQSIGIEKIREHEQSLTLYTIDRLKKTFAENITILGPQDHDLRSSIISFVFKDIHPHDIASVLGEHNICVRAGEHCTMPLHQSLDIDATTRLSLSIYNTREDIDTLIDVLKKIQTMFC